MRHRVTLYKKYAWIFGSLTGGALLFSGVLNISAVYEESQSAMLKVQHEKAQAAADQIAQYFFGIEQRIGMTSVSAVSAVSNKQSRKTLLEQRAAEIQYLRRTSAIREIRLIEPNGREYLHVSRYAPDVVRSGADFSRADFFKRVKTGRSYRSPVYFQDAAPSMTLAMPVGPEGAGITVAEIDLEFLLANISRIKVGQSGLAYAIDVNGHLIAHPDIGLILARTNMAGLPQVQAALSGTDGVDPVTRHAHRKNGEPVVTAFSRIAQLDWFVFVEEPLSEAYHPLYRQAVRSAALVLVSILFAVWACVMLVRRMVKPIELLRMGTIRVGSGALNHRIHIDTGDELEALADGFNQMAAQLQESYGTLEKKVADRTRELEELNGKLATLTITDALTGIANRRRFDEVLASEWQRASRSGQPLTLGLFDIDWFKPYNDYYGHQAGDECLRQVARVLTLTIGRTSDLVARYGGEEFVFISPDMDTTAALAMARKLCATLRAQALPHAESSFGIVTISVGIAVAVPDANNSVEELIKAADQAMYQAKAQGRNQVVLAGHV